MITNNTDEYIQRLHHVSLKSRGLLPEQSGIYYVLDKNFVIWYIGKAKNLRSRWVGESHHRFDQFKKQRKQQFVIYYEIVAESQLDAVEQQRIEQYNPQLNRTKVKTQKPRPAETLLRETLTLIAPYSFVLGVEPPRKQETKLIEDSVNWRDNWRVQKAVQPLKVIHICINLGELEEAIKDKKWLSICRLLRNVFRKRSNYSNNWECKGKASDEYLGIFYMRRFLANGFAIEVYVTRPEVVKVIQNYDLTQVAGVEIRTISETSLAEIKNKCQLMVVGMYMYSENQSQAYEQYCRRVIGRLSPYRQDMVKLLFNENLDTSKLQILPKENRITEENATGLPARLASLIAKKEYLKALLIERDIDLNRYQVNKYLESLPKDNNYVDSNHDKRMNVYVKSFINSDLRNLSPYHRTGYREVFLEATVDKIYFLLLEPYIEEFTKVELKEGEGYVKKIYVSARKFLVPAMLSVTLNGKWKAEIPFGPKYNMSYSEVISIIENRLQKSGIPKLRFSFNFESSRS
jgi:predicted GIY-YIG superfamily endonuclease